MSSDTTGTRFTFAEPLNGMMVSLLLLFAGVFLLQLLVPPFQRFALDYLALDTSAFLSRFRLWQAVTSIFLHGGIAHFVGNMAFLWFFGSALSNAWRRKEFMAYFFACGITGSLCFYVFDVVRGVESVGLGASGAIFGLMVAYAIVFGNRVVLAFFLIPMKARYFVAICFAIEIAALFAGTPDGVGHIAHLGGAICGAVYLRIAWKQGMPRPWKRPASKSRLSGIEVMEQQDD